ETVLLLSISIFELLELELLRLHQDSAPVGALDPIVDGVRHHPIARANLNDEEVVGRRGKLSQRPIELRLASSPLPQHPRVVAAEHQAGAAGPKYSRQHCPKSRASAHLAP